MRLAALLLLLAPGPASARALSAVPLRPPIAVPLHAPVSIPLRPLLLQPALRSELRRAWEGASSDGARAGSDRSFARLTGEALPRRPAVLAEPGLAALPAARPRRARPSLAVALAPVVPKADAAAANLSLLAAALAPAAASAALPAAAGAAAGWAWASLMEAGAHRHIQHAGPRMRAFWRRLGPLGRPFEKAHAGHAVGHHGSVARSYAKPFGSGPRAASARERMDAWLRSKGAERYIAEGYGMTLSWAGVARFELFLLPGYVAIWCAWGLPGLAGALIPGFFLPWTSKVLHPYLHLPRAEIERRASPLMLWFLDTWYVRLAARLHFVHHADPRVNQNLVLGADLFLGLRLPEPDHLRVMAELDLLH